MSHEVLTAKLCELEEQLSHLNSRILLSETGNHSQLQQEIDALSQEYRETELNLRKKLRTSRTEVVSILADMYEQMEQIIQTSKITLQQQQANTDDPDAVAEEKILLAEYALDFAIQACNHALLLAMQAIDTQFTQSEKERRIL